MRNFLFRKSTRFLLLFLFVPLWLSAQNITVTGKVTDESGEALIGVSITEKGTANGVASDMDGNYSLSVSRNATLEFKYMGYTPVSVNINAGGNFNVVMQEDSKALQEVVVIGYGTQRREAVTGSVASMQGNVLREVNTGNVTNALQGRVAGVQIQQTNSQPGADMQIRIRGTRSLTGSNDPLIVLDGIPFGGKLNEINPNDVKTMDILKDASATAIYGSRGAGGVIIITTYKGNMDAKPRVSYNGYYGIKSLYHRFPMMTGDELYELRKVAGMYKDTQGNPTMGLDEAQGTNTDWQDLMYKNSYTTNHNIGISGGSETGSYQVGTGYFNDNSLSPGQDYSRINLRASFEQNIGKYLRFGMTTSNNYNITNGQNLSRYQTLAASPLINPYNEDGTLKRSVSSVVDNIWNHTREHVEELGDTWVDNQRRFGSYNSLYGDVKIPGIDGLSYRITAGLDYTSMQRGRYTGQGVFSDNATSTSTASLDKNQYYKWAVENLITYEKYIDKHHITLNGLYSAEQGHYDRSYVNATNVPPDFQYWNIGQAPSGNVTYNPKDQDFWERGIISLMGRVMYDYDARYMFLASIRRDGSSVLAEGKKWINYPAFSAGWNIGQESFMESAKDYVNNLKLRVGWGLTSNQAIDPYTTLGSLETRPYNFGTTTTTGYYVLTTPNPELGWEYTKVWNYGLDFSFLQNRLSGAFEYYNAETYDILQKVTLPGSGGVGSYLANIGEMNNRGVELSLNGVIFDNKDGWSWEAGINFYTNKNKITKLVSTTGKEVDEKDEANCWFKGHPINVIFDYKAIGLWQEGDQYLNVLEPGGNVGMIKVLYTGGYNDDGTPKRAINAEDRQKISADPDWLGGFTTRVSYKNWDLNVIGTYQHGGILVSSLHASNGYLNLLTGRRGNVKVDYWTPENTDAKYPKPGGILSGDNPKYGSTMGYFDASYLKVGQITLGYNFDPKAQWFKSMGLGTARLYCTLQNAFVLFSPFNKETGLDPVTNSFGNENAAVTGSLPYRAASMLTIGTNSPQTRNFVLGLNLSF